ncbi:thiamine pyrophosphate-dependent enzyme [Prosthecobacter sp. SYSU 5D2]|uniref:dehydrogenase E1 component subunit alpha/beta n=1 Tax=Prosthecobacter sp. SYSU 5D2 TaxID=3134134 RepID=UPI0031FF3E5C
MQSTLKEYPDVPENLLSKATLIREVEDAFLRLFTEGKIHGTVHTCVGQEFSALAFAGQLKDGDVVFSNHRGHGHFLAFTDDVEGLIAELMGKRSGVCSGIGSSQHLCAKGFFTNGIQGGIVPCAAGHAFAQQLQGYTNRVGVVYIGDGTLGEGVVYETFNLISLLNIPLLVVCEDNGVAQSTPRTRSLAGSITERAAAFGIQVWSGSTQIPSDLYAIASEAIEHVRSRQKPGFFHVITERLNSHSKGDDERSSMLVAKIRDEDYLNRQATKNPPLIKQLRLEAQNRINAAVERAENHSALRIEEYLAFSKPGHCNYTWEAMNFPSDDVRMVTYMQDAWNAVMSEFPKVVMIGEDILSPYGGAFKVTKGLSDKYPDRIISTPISEAAITGLANGLALAGMIPVVEIMFGDFITLSLDQLINHAAKFRHMYSGNATCPLILRTPMGGGRGYGPTHSQSLEKLVAGIDTVITVAPNVLQSPEKLIRSAVESDNPVVIIENKLDYGRRIVRPNLPGYDAETNDAPFPSIRLTPHGTRAELTIATYGGMVTTAIETTRLLFAEHEILADIIILTQIGPIDVQPIITSIEVTGKLVTIEEGSPTCGVGAEIIAQTLDKVPHTKTLRQGALPVPIPSPPALEAQVLPSVQELVLQIASFFHA